MRRVAAVIGLAGLLATGSVTTADAENRASPTPSPAATAAPPTCPAATGAIAPLDPVESGAARAYAITFRTYGAAPGKLSGTVSLFAGASRYDVPFENAIAVPATHEADQTASPIVVSFSSATTIDGAYLSSISGPNGGPCGFGNISHVLKRTQSTIEREQTILQRATLVPPIAAPPPVADPIPCKTPNVAAGTLYAVQPILPAVLQQRSDARGTVIVGLHLDESGRIDASWIYQSVGIDGVDKAALDAADHSAYTAEIYRCKPVSGLYLFRADFVN